MIKFFLAHKLTLIVFLLLLAISLQLLFAMQWTSLTCDEVLHAPAGYAFIKSGEFRLSPETPPLMKVATAFPLLFLNLKAPLDHPSWRDNKIFEFGRQFLFYYNSSYNKTVFWMRLPIVLMSLILALVVFRWAKELYGVSAGILALFLYAFEPNILSHSMLATTDLGAALFIFLAAYSYWKYYRNPTKMNLLWAGLALGLALATKFTALLLLPTVLFIIFTIALFSSKSSIGLSFNRSQVSLQNTSSLKSKIWQILKSLILVMLPMIAIASTVIFASYGFQLKPLLATEGQHLKLVKIIPPSKSIITRTLYYILENTPVPLTQWIKGLFAAREHTRHGHAAFLMGKHSTMGWWYYHLIAFLIKTPIPFLLFLLLALVFLFIKEQAVSRITDEIFLLIPVVVLFLSSFFTHINIGLRHILPVYPFLFVFAGRITTPKLKHQSVYKFALVSLVLWYIISSITIYPHYLAYFNEFIGGPENGYKYLVDSNLDWGQDLVGLKKYMKENKIKKIKLSYFGTAIPEFYGISYEEITEKEAHQYTPGIYAISATNLQNVYEEDKTRFAWLKKYKPVDNVGYSIFIYNIPKKQR